MRLKLFLTPLLVVAASLLASPQFLQRMLGCSLVSRQWMQVLHSAFLVAMIAGASLTGWENMTTTLSRVGEFNDMPTLQLVEFIRGHARHEEAFAGNMATMATIFCTTDQPIANHPHYEDATLRERTLKLYQGYAHIDDDDFAAVLQRHNVTYFLNDSAWCQRNRRPGCNMAELYPSYEGRVSTFCERWRTKQVGYSTKYFSVTFANQRYQILKLQK
eukprot:m.218948 g.218948  ORF g.218948 m.218948 type:complete len:217 (+) comp16995_c2_seq14:1948-2598(+)